MLELVHMPHRAQGRNPVNHLSQLRPTGGQFTCRDVWDEPGLAVMAPTDKGSGDIVDGGGHCGV